MSEEIEVIESRTPVIFKSDKIEEFRKRAFHLHPCGKEAIPQGESPIAMRVWFTDERTVKFRGDRNSGYVNIMISNLRRLIFKYMSEKKLAKVIMYDNRPEVFSKVILLIENGQVIENKFPLYSNEFKIKKPVI
jgi:hypothetical protein